MGFETVVALRRVFLVVDVRFEYRIDVASRVFLLADIYPLYILYCLGRRWSVYGSRGEDPSEVRRIYNRHYITDSGSYRDFVIDADARFEFLTE